MKKTLLAGILMTGLLALTSCGRNLGKEVTVEAYTKALEDLEVKQPSTITTKGTLTSNGDKVDLSWTVTKDNRKEEKSIAILAVLAEYDVEETYFMSLAFSVNKDCSVKYYQDGKKLGLTMKGSGKIESQSASLDCAYQYDENGLPIYIKTNASYTKSSKTDTVVADLTISYVYSTEK